MEAAQFGAITVGHVPYAAAAVTPVAGCPGEHRPPKACVALCGGSRGDNDALNVRSGTAAADLAAVDTVGAFERLQPRGGLAVGVNFTQSPAAVAAVIECVVRESECLACVARAVHAAAHGWTEADNAAALQHILLD